LKRSGLQVIADELRECSSWPSFVDKAPSMPEFLPAATTALTILGYRPRSRRHEQRQKLIASMSVRGNRRRPGRELLARVEFRALQVSAVSSHAVGSVNRIRIGKLAGRLVLGVRSRPPVWYDVLSMSSRPGNRRELRHSESSGIVECTSAQ